MTYSTTTLTRRAVRREFTKQAKTINKYDTNAWIQYGVACINMLAVQFPSSNPNDFRTDLVEIGQRYLNA